MADNKQIAAEVLEAVGGKNNVTNVMHCMTRLRFNLTATGMHLAIMTVVLVQFTSTGVDSFFFPAAMTCIYAIVGCELAFLIRAKTTEQKNLGISCMMAQLLGGVAEPGIFGILLQYKKLLFAEMLGGLAGGLYIGLTNTSYYVMSSTNFLAFLCYGGGTTANLINGIIACVIAFVVALAAGLVLGFKNKEAV